MIEMPRWLGAALVLTLLACQDKGELRSAGDGSEDKLSDAASSPVTEPEREAGKPDPAMEPEADAQGPADGTVRADAASSNLAEASADGGPSDAPDGGRDASAPAPLRSDSVRLPFRPIEVVYSRALDRMIIGAGEPSRLIVLDPESAHFDEIALPRLPDVLSLRPDGLAVAIGHDRLITVVDLQQRAISHTFPIDGPVGALALGSQGYLYFVPGTGQWVRLSSLQLATGTITLDDTRISDKAQLALHPAGGQLFVGEHERDVRRYDLRSGTAHYQPRPAPSEAMPCLDITFSGDGTRLFCRPWLLSVGPAPIWELRKTDLERPSGQIDDPPPAGPLLVVAHLPGEESAISVRDDASLQLLQTLHAPRYRLAGAPHPSLFRAAFLNAASSRIYALVEAAPKTPLVHDTALVRLDVAAGRAAEPPPFLDVERSLESQLPTTADPVRLLGLRILDAEYSRYLERIVAVAADIAHLFLLEPATGQLESVPLPTPETVRAVSVRPDGRAAAVVQWSSVSLIDLETRAVVQTLALRAYDVLLSGNGYLYALTESVGAGLQSIALASGQITPILAPINHAVVALHVAGDRIYGADAIGTPSAVSRWDTADGVARYAYQNNVVYFEYGTMRLFDSCRRMWLSDDGQRVFTGCGDVLRTTNVPRSDLRPNGRIDIAGRMNALAHSSKAGLIALSLPTIALPQERTRISFYDADFLAKLGDVELPTFSLLGAEQRLDPTFMFFRPDGSEVYVVGDRPSEDGSRSGLVRLTR